MKNIHPGFQFRKTDDCVLYYNLQFDEKRNFPRLLNVLGWIKKSTTSIGLYVEQMQNCLDLEC